MRREILKTVLNSRRVKLAYLFGSQKDAGIAFLDGKSQGIDKTADLDIGIVFEKLPQCPFEVYGEIYAKLSMLFEPFAVDLVFLQETDPLFQYEAINGELIYCGDEDFLNEYEEMIMKMASDLSFKKREFEKDFLEAIKDGYFEIAHR
ncbi:MAG: nucleotidyltransferase domain-containing protein [Deltaproteobacteria bacterium]|nr:nucleotidyltransferase domain-containing protein [Deltaproteobacteria bacterium]